MNIYLIMLVKSANQSKLFNIKLISLKDNMLTIAVINKRKILKNLEFTNYI